MDDSGPKKVVPRGRPFPKGVSANPTGKLPGTRNAATLAIEALLDGQSGALTSKAIEMALDGNIAALRMVWDRILPPRRERMLQFRLPPMKTAEDAIGAIAQIAEGVGEGELSESEARTLGGLVQTFLEAHAHMDFEQRVTKLEVIKSAVEEKALDIREQNTPQLPLGAFKRKAVE